MSTIIYPLGGGKTKVPSSIPMWKARQVMIEEDLLDRVLDVLKSIPDAKERRKALDKLEYSSNMLRSDPLLTKLVVQLGLTEAQVDAMFIHAEQFE